MVLQSCFGEIHTVNWRMEYLYGLFKNPNLKWIRILSIDSCFYATSQLEATLSSFIGHIPDNSLERVEIDYKHPLKDLTTVLMRKNQPRIQNLSLNPTIGNQLWQWTIAQHPYLSSTRHLLELEFYKLPFRKVDGLLPNLEVPRLKFLKFVSCDGNLFVPADGCSPYPMLFSTKLDRITHLSCNDMMMNYNSIIPLYMFPSLTHLALDHCSHIGASLAAYKSPTLKDLRIRCSTSDTTIFAKFEELDNINRLLSSFKGLELLALDPSWTASTIIHRPVWLRILLAIPNSHASTLRGLVLREYLSTDTRIDTKIALFEAAKKCKALRLLEILTDKNLGTMKLYVRYSSIENLIIFDNNRTNLRESRRNYFQNYRNWKRSARFRFR